MAHMKISTLKKRIYEAISEDTSHLYSDCAWENVYRIIDKIGTVLKFYRSDLQFDVAVENGGYKELNGSRWKEYKISITDQDKVALQGCLNAHAAGIIEDPFKYYDVSVILN